MRKCVPIFAQEKSQIVFIVVFVYEKPVGDIVFIAINQFLQTHAVTPVGTLSVKLAHQRRPNRNSGSHTHIMHKKTAVF